jgi:hypothetical protein
MPGGVRGWHAPTSPTRLVGEAAMASAIKSETPPLGGSPSAWSTGRTAEACLIGSSSDAE